jgi:hypothetical protein
MTREQTGRAAIDDLCAILTILDEAEDFGLASVQRQIRDVIGGPEGQPAGGLWRRVLDLSYDDEEPTPQRTERPAPALTNPTRPIYAPIGQPGGYDLYDSLPDLLSEGFPDATPVEVDRGHGTDVEMTTIAELRQAQEANHEPAG